MRSRRLGIATCVFLLLVSSLAGSTSARPPDLDTDPVAADDAAAKAANPADRTAASDTTWLADWSFDSGTTCDDTGWIRYDNRILNDGSNWWSVDGRYSGTGGISGQAAVLARHDLTWARDGYGNGWDYSIVLEYQGASTLAFDMLSDSEPGMDFVQVEADSAGASESRVDYVAAPMNGPSAYRQVLLSMSGLQNSAVGPLALPDFGVPTTVHEVYIRFESDHAYSDEDGLYASDWNAGLVVDDIVVTGGLTYSETFEAVLDPHVTLANTAPSTPFGEWARLWRQATDNDACTDNWSCAWIFSDPALPASTSQMAFGPGGAVVRNWLDDVLVSPWVALGEDPSPGATILSYRRFPGNLYSNSRIVMNWSIRSRVRLDNTDTPAPGDSIDLVTPWKHASTWNSLNPFTWRTEIANVTSYVPAAATAVQVRFRVSDYQYIAGAAPPVTLDPGPGPYVDRVRIGRRVSGPTFYYADTGYLLAQDTFPGVLQTLMCAGQTYSQYVPTTDRFGTCEFSQAREVGWGNVSDPLCTARCDSIEFQVVDEGGSGIANVWLLGTIVSGPHAGKAPPPWTVEPSGFFRVPAYRGLSCGSGLTWGLYTADLDDEYFRGGDVLLYVLAAVDSAGGFASFPPGLVSEPTSVAHAEAETGGLLEVSFLPTIDWDPAYLARIAAHPSGKLDPTPEEIANSSQRACMLYVNQTVRVPRSVLAHRTAFLRTLDRLGYAHFCDVYDQNGLGHQNNHLAGRATIQQATGYALIVQDAGRYASHWTLPMGCAVEGIYPQVQWYRDWLAGAAAGEAGGATLWLIGSNVMESSDFCGPNPLLLDDMGAVLLSAGQPSGGFPQVTGQASFTWADSTTTDFSSDGMRLSGQSCPTQFEYDGLGASGTAVITHGWVPGTTPGEGAFVLNANPAAGWNTILSSVVWEDMVGTEGSPPGAPGDVVAGRILQAVLPPGCAAQIDPTDVAGGRPALPAVTRLGSNYPNPFNPATTVVFDLARGGRVRVEVFDVAGRRVRTLVDQHLDAGWNHRATWNGRDDGGLAVATGLYFCRLEAPGQSATRKLILVR